MCGIAGAWSASLPTAETVQTMCNTLIHRGPDDEGYITRGSVTLGMRRLSIIDVANGQQPVSNEDGTIHVVMNGEIYNYAHLRRHLIDRGHILQSHSDTEVLPHLYEEYGNAFVEHLRGMFAFALLDERKGLIVLGRDRLGKKPLYYYAHGGELLFASELKGLMATGRIPRTPDMVAVHHYLMLQYVPDPWSAIAGVNKLAPASLAVFDGKSLRTSQYWSLSYLPKLEISYEDAVEQVSQRLSDAVAVRLVGERPVGAFLSGGVDSSLVVSRMARLVTGQLKTYCVGFSEASHDERRYARLAAEAFGTSHTEVVLSPTADLVLSVAAAYDDPYADSSALPTYEVSRLAASDVTVALTGDGGDEAFGGYDRYRAIASTSWLRLPEPVAGPARVLTNWAVDRTETGTLAQRLARLANTISLPPAERYVNVMSYFKQPQRESLYTPEHRASMLGEDTPALLTKLFMAANTKVITERLMFADVNSYLPGDLLVKVDTATMAHGLEARSPFLDSDLMEFAARLPTAYKLNNREGKRLLKTLARRELPAKMVDRQKSGFSVPLGAWLRGPLRPLCEQRLSAAWFVNEGYFSRSAVDTLVREHMQGADHGKRVWALLMLELWADRFLV